MCKTTLLKQKQEILKKNPKDFVLIEKDERLIDILNEKFGTTVKIVNDDMLKFAYDKYLKSNLIIFGNLPYNISTQILVKWIKIKEVDKNLQAKNFIKINAMMDNSILLTYNVPFYKEDKIYEDQLNIFDNRII